MSADLKKVMTQSRIVIVCGTGGVGKTTVSAALALKGALDGLNSVVVTIDPARRLAHTLGLDNLPNQPQAIDEALWKVNDRKDGDAAPSGTFSALQLDAKATFDDLIRSQSANPAQAERILNNQIYRNLSGALGGTQEYMAMEKLYELESGNRFDLIVVDTPPSRHALDFLEAPGRLTRFLEHPVTRLLTAPTRLYLRAANRAMMGLLRAMSRVVGTEVVEDAIAFFGAFEGMESGFRQRAARIETVINSSDTSFLVVTSARQDSIEEARFFGQRLRQTGQRVAGVIVNRIHPRLTDRTSAQFEADAGIAVADSTLVAAIENLARWEALAQREKDQVNKLVADLGTTVTVLVPQFGREIYDMESLNQMSESLFVGAEK
ncbi:MAG: ArsA family ATPase [Acidimicrobiia bacterium]|jgi:anion-transporting  ArsA/GET3 family ATPase|nr:ArsA family ATPase [Acidimicrobiia bacterium]MBP8179623.1 ArsA family ATPase [Acidimicrobiia bacterium]